MPQDNSSILMDAMASALKQYEETMGEPFTVTPELELVKDEAFWAEVQWRDDQLTLFITQGLINATLLLWKDMLESPDFDAIADVSAEDMTYLSLVWLILHELHHYQMGHFDLCDTYRLSEAKEPNRFGAVQRASTMPPPSLVGLHPTDLPKVEPCLELQADHDAIEMLLDAYSSEGWPDIRLRVAAISAMMVLIEREDFKRGHALSSHPKAATRIFQLLGHVIHMPLIAATLSLDESDLPSDEEQAAFNRDVVIPAYLDAVKLAVAAGATSISDDLGSAEAFFQDVQIALLADPAAFEQLRTAGAKQWANLVMLNQVLLERMT